MNKKRVTAKINVSQASDLLALKHRLESEQRKLENNKSKFESWRQHEEARLLAQAKESNDIFLGNQQKNAELDSLLIAIRDFIHEQKKFNERMSASMDKLRNATGTLRIQPYDQGALNLLSNTAKSIVALAQLSSMRMQMLEFNIVPDIFASMTSKKFAIFKEFEKIYKSINNGNDTVRDKFIMDGKSVATYSTKRILTIGIFILLENAWKYTPKDEQITIHFDENSERINVTIRNLGPKILPGEIGKLTERLYRGENARVTPKVDGKGLGLNIAKDIFNICGVNFSIEAPNTESTIIGRIEYTPFIVHLRFPL